MVKMFPHCCETREKRVVLIVLGMRKPYFVSSCPERVEVKRRWSLVMPITTAKSPEVVQIWKLSHKLSFIKIVKTYYMHIM